MSRKHSFILFLLVLPLFIQAQITLPKIIGDNMVLQQGKPINIWGTADAGERITVNFKGQNYSTVANSDGDWEVVMFSQDADTVANNMTVSGKNSRIIIKNILIGEVWLASGQSNMEYSMNKHPNYVKPVRGDKERLYNEFKEADNPLIRLFYVEKNITADTLPSKGWKEISEESLAPFSAPAYFFAKKLAEELQVPIGIISSSWGGTPIETWTSVEAYRNSEVFSKNIIDGKLNDVKVGERFEKMVSPMIPFSLKGFIWYQGETNLINGDTLVYAEKMKLMVDDWRERWNDKELPFYYAQIAPHTYSRRKNPQGVQYDPYILPLFWEVQFLAQDIPHTAMIVTTDLVDYTRDIHPPYKWIVGDRFARLALVRDYGYDELIPSGPVLNGYSINDGKILLRFDNTGEGLTTRDGRSPDWFELCGSDGTYYKADAVINGSCITLYNDNVKEPVAARYAWHETAMPNLVNSDGLPAVPFRTDSFVWNYNK